MAWELWTTERDKEVLVENDEPGPGTHRAGVSHSILHRTTPSGVLSQAQHYHY